MIKKFLFYILFICLTFSLFACGEVTIESVSVKEDTIPSYVSLNSTNNDLASVLDDIKILVVKSDDSTKELPIQLEMLSVEDQQKLKTVGTHDITIKYSGIQAVLKIEVKDVYSVKVLMPDNTPASGNIKVQWCTDTNCYPTKTINENGICENPLNEGKYYVHLDNLPEGYTYNPNAYITDKDNKNIEIVLSSLSSFTKGDGTEGNPYEMTTGIYEVSFEAQGTNDLKYFAFSTTEAGTYKLESLAVDKNAINRIDPYLGYLGDKLDTNNLDPNGNIQNVTNFKYSFEAEANKTYYFVVMCSSADMYPADFTIMITK